MTTLSMHYRYSLEALMAAALAGCVSVACISGCGGQALSDREPSSSGEPYSSQQASSAAPDEAPGLVPPAPGGYDPAPVASGARGLPADVPRPPAAPGLPIEWSPNGGPPHVFLEKSTIGTTFELVEASRRICVRGKLDPVPDGDYPNYWGGEVGLVFVMDAEQQVPPGAGTAASGFAFRLSGTLPPLLRFRVGAAGEVPLFSQYCMHLPLTTGTQTAVFLDELAYECWNGAGQPFPEAAGAALVSWQVPASESTTQAFDFCIEQIEALP